MVDGAVRKEYADTHKLIYQIPFDEGEKMDSLLRYLEQNFPNLSLAIEQTSLEDAYLKIAKLDNSEVVRVEEAHDYVQKVEKYRKIEGEFNKCGQFKSVFERRLIVFFREPKQWMMILGPFINVTIIVLIFYAFVKLLTGLDFTGHTVNEDEEFED